MLLKSSIFSFLGNFTGFLTSIVSGMLIARYLGPSGKGEVFLGVQCASLGSLVLSLGLGSSYLYHLRRSVLTEVQAIAHATSVLIIVVAVSGVVFVGAPSVLRAITGHSLTDPLICVMLGLLVLNMAVTLYGGILMSHPKGVQWTSVFAIVAGVTYISALTVLVVVLHLGAIGALAAVALPVAARVILILSKSSWRAASGAGIRVLRSSRPLIGYGLSSFAGNVMLTTASRVDSFIINSYAGPGPLGVYSVAVSLAELTLMAPSALGIALFPHLTSQSESDRVCTVARVARISGLLGFTCAVPLAAIGYPAIGLMFGPRFASAYHPFLALLPGIVAMTTAYSYANYFSSIGRPAVNAVVFGAGMVINVCCNLLVVPRFGVVGAAWVTSVDYLCVMGIFVEIISRRTGVNRRTLFVPGSEDVRFIWAKAVSVAPLRWCVRVVTA